MGFFSGSQNPEAGNSSLQKLLNGIGAEILSRLSIGDTDFKQE
jgi:hypothetical protein